MIPPPWVAYVLAAVVALGAAGWIGHRWAEGAAALDAVEQHVAEMEAQRAALAAALKQIETDRAAWRQAAEEARALSARFETIAEELHANDQQTAQRFAALAAEFDAAFAARPDLRGLRVGDRLFEAWRRANAGAGPAAGAGAAAGDSGGPDAGLSRPSATGG